MQSQVRRESSSDHPSYLCSSVCIRGPTVFGFIRLSPWIQKFKRKRFATDPHRFSQTNAKPDETTILFWSSVLSVFICVHPWPARLWLYSFVVMNSEIQAKAFCHRCTQIFTDKCKARWDENPLLIISLICVNPCASVARPSLALFVCRHEFRNSSESILPQIHTDFHR